jgi:hypothetical protein
MELLLRMLNNFNRGMLMNYGMGKELIEEAIEKELGFYKICSKHGFSI